MLLGWAALVWRDRAEEPGSPRLLLFVGYLVALSIGIHLGVALVVQSPIRTLETNLHETEVLLQAAAARGVPFLLTSSSEVYGKSEKTVFTEEDDLLIGPPTRLTAAPFAGNNASHRLMPQGRSSPSCRNSPASPPSPRRST